MGDHDPARYPGPGMRRDQWVLLILVIVSAALLFDTLLHLDVFPNTFPSLHLPSGPVDLLLPAGIVTVQLFCILYLWRSFRRQASLKASLASTMREREMETRKVNEILDSIPDRISIQDPGYRVLYQNQAHRAALGDQVGQLCYEVYAGRAEVCPECPLTRVFAEGKVQRIEKSNRVEGRPVWVEINASPLRDAAGELVAGIEVVRDTTERREREEAVRCLTEQLRDRNRELEAFGSALSHDLRQPLTKIYLSAQALDEVFPMEDYPAGDFLVGSIREGCEEMEALLEAMLTLSRVTRHHLRLATVPLSDVAEEISLELRASEPERAGGFSIEPELRASGDPSLVRVLLRNLLSNAWKYTRNCAEAQIVFDSTAVQGETVYRVRDNGIGFDMQDAERLFQPFERLHSGKEFPGTGIGLVTCRRIVERHGGRIWVEASAGDGATFFFTLSPAPASGRA